MPTLRPEQRVAATTVATQSQLLLADVGAGKTATVATAIRHRRLLEGNKRVLVLGTLRICDMVWRQELAIWAPELSYASTAGKNAVQRSYLMESKSIDVVGLNFDNLIWAIERYGERLPELFPWLIIDESSKLENPGSKSFQAIKPLLPLFEWRLPMTGTPRANHLYDLWGNVYLADLGEALGQYRNAFLQRWFFPVRRVFGIDWVPRHKAEQEIAEAISSTVHRMPFVWPAPIEVDMLIPRQPLVGDIQDEVDKLLKGEAKNVVIRGITFARNGHRISAKLLQLSSGFVYNDKKEVVVFHKAKIEALAEIVHEAKGEPIMVVFQFDHERDAILKAFPQSKLLDSNTVLDAWNAGRIEMLLVHPLSCGHGVNAQFSGSDLQVWFTPTMDAELYTQTVGRMNRSGSKKTLRVIRLIMKGTKDLAAYMVVAARQKGEHATLEMFE